MVLVLDHTHHHSNSGECPVDLGNLRGHPHQTSYIGELADYQ